MPATTLDTTGALIVIDLQKGIVGIPTAHPTADIVARSASLHALSANEVCPSFWFNVLAGK
jgi:hypothetical protein